MRAPAALALCICLALAGCAQDAAPPNTETDPEPLATGFLRGVVVDEAVRPVEGAVVTTLHGGAEAAVLTTDADGNFGIGGLEPGNYTVNVTKAGFVAHEVDAEVVGGEQTPAPVQVTLRAQVVDTSFIMSLPWGGVVGCAMGANWCAVVDLYTGLKVTNDASGKQFYDEFLGQGRVPDHVQIEVVWEPTLPTGTHMSMEVWAGNWEQWETFGSQEHYGYTVFQESPMTVTLDQEQLETGLVGTETGIGLGLYAGCVTWPDCWVEHGAPQAMVNQPFEAFLHAFYGCLPPEGWTFVADGEARCA